MFEGKRASSLDDMGIAALSVGMSQARTQQQLGVSVLEMAMDASAEMVDNLMEEMAASLDPSVGQSVDILA